MLLMVLNPEKEQNVWRIIAETEIKDPITKAITERANRIPQKNNKEENLLNQNQRLRLRKRSHQTIGRSKGKNQEDLNRKRKKPRTIKEVTRKTTLPKSRDESQTIQNQRKSRIQNLSLFPKRIKNASQERKDRLATECFLWNKRFVGFVEY